MRATQPTTVSILSALAREGAELRDALQLKVDKQRNHRRVVGHDAYCEDEQASDWQSVEGPYGRCLSLLEQAAGVQEPDGFHPLFEAVAKSLVSVQSLTSEYHPNGRHYDNDGDDVPQVTALSPTHPPRETNETVSVADTDDDQQSRRLTAVGCHSAVKVLQQAVVLPLKHPQLFDRQCPPTATVLLYGPPGSGKTLLAQSIATEAGARLLTLSAADLLSKWVGESEKIVRDAFTGIDNEEEKGTVKKAKQQVVLFFDEVDALCGSRGADGESEAARRVKTEFLLRMQHLLDSSRSAAGSRPQVVVLASTNLPWELDAAFLRRFQQKVFVGLPSRDDVAALVSSYLDGNTPQGQSTSSSSLSISGDEIASLSNTLYDRAYSRAEIAEVLRRGSARRLVELHDATLFRRDDATGLYHPVAPDASCSEASMGTDECTAAGNTEASHSALIRCSVMEIASSQLAPLRPATHDDFMYAVKTSDILPVGRSQDAPYVQWAATGRKPP